jgi:acylphosphatase
MREARRYIISGRVQGVGFRYFTQAAAAREAVSGWVENQADGRVAIHAEGDAEALERFERDIRRGPRGARVEHVEIASTTADARNTRFSIK